MILEGTVKVTGDAFFAALVENLAKAMKTHSAWVTEYIETSHQLRALAFWADGQLLTDFMVDMDGTPCGDVIEHVELVHHPDNLINIYPKDSLLKQENSKTDLTPEQIIAIGTDGIWETFNKQGEMFGKGRFREIIRKNAYMGSNEILNAVFNEIDIFSKGLKKKDDITLVIIKIEETSEEGVDWQI